ncbi:hypothetical protein FQU76_33600 [Streptomyces qinzhouensis]|uniref:Uncharacterized protein n=1 Tax=Streptomyces qinzhouensis TaxID=2599401 RepID=A0A5B8JGN2_9ACTN|nr:hypothetical protein FQU76_00140 [Streptomyces qinzhouensis]QDY80636.1 hypothetical protein FQU76_33600 [Streptomyces qinzhouensis]
MSGEHGQAAQGRVIRVRPDGLLPGAVLAQSLDNQWAGAELTKRMVRRGKGFREVAAERERDVRAEYFRSLINTRQVVANRVFFYNNPAMSRDLVEGGSARRAHQQLLAEGALIPFLLNEREPTERPAGMDLDEAGFNAWRDTVESMPSGERMTCVRMSWNDQENVRDARSALFNPFAARVQGLTAKDIPLLASQLGVRADLLGPFSERIGEVVQSSNELRTQGALVTRNHLYERFVSLPGSRVSDGRFDRRKPFAGEVKQLLDLIYNVNLADALEMYPLTPADSLRRVILQEWRDLRVQTSQDVIRDPEEVVRYLQRQIFATVQDRLTPAGIDALELEDVRTLRQTDEWQVYMSAFDTLVADPGTFQERVHQVFSGYVGLNSRIVALSQRRRSDASGETRWAPVVEVAVSIGGSMITAVTGDGAWAVTGSLGGAVAGAYGGSVQLILRNRAAGRREQKFAREIAAIRFDSVREWEQLQELVRRLPGYRETRAAGAATGSSTTQEIPEY